MQKISKNEWLLTGLKVLEENGVGALRVEHLAKELGVSKSGFYWHFKNRNDLREQMLNYWASEFTTAVTLNPSVLEGTPRERLENAMVMILDHNLTRYEVPMRSWAAEDPKIASIVRKIYKQRTDFIGQIFEDLGFKGDELKMWTQLFVAYHTW